MKTIKERIEEERADIVPLYICDIFSHICIGTVTEDMEPSAFSRFLNLKPSGEVNILDNVRASYMISSIKCCLSARYQKKWEEEMIKLCKINSYKNHHNDAEKSEKNKDFVRDIKEAVANIETIKKNYLRFFT